MKEVEYNAADEEMVEEAEKKQRLAREQELEDIKTILQHPSGIRFFRRFMEEGKIFRTTYTGNSNTYFLEGARNLALKFFSDICECSPNKINEIMIKKTEARNK